MGHRTKRAGPAHGPCAFCGCARVLVVGPLDPVLCAVSCALCPVSYILCPMSFLCPMSCVICPMSYGFSNLPYAQGGILASWQNFLSWQTLSEPILEGHDMTILADQPILASPTVPKGPGPLANPKRRALWAGPSLLGPAPTAPPPGSNCLTG